MQDRLPSAYTRALKYPLRSSLKGIDLHNAVLDLALSYHHNYEMIFPTINDTPILVHFVRQLALPGMFSENSGFSYANCLSRNACHSERCTVNDEILISVAH